MIEHGGSFPIQTEWRAATGPLPLSGEEGRSAGQGDLASGSVPLRETENDRVDIGGRPDADEPGTSLIRRGDLLPATREVIGDGSDAEEESTGSSLFRFAITQYNRIAALVSTPTALPGTIFEMYA